MALTVSKMIRVFQFQGIRLPDPNPEMSVEEVKALYAAQYPELATAVVEFARLWAQPLACMRHVAALCKRALSFKKFKSPRQSTLLQSAVTYRIQLRPRR